MDEKWPNYQGMAAWYWMSHQYHLTFYFWCDDGGEDDNGGDELDSRGGNAASSKEGAPLKCKGKRVKKQKKREVKQAYTKIKEDGRDQGGGRQQQGKHTTYPHPHINKV